MKYAGFPTSPPGSEQYQTELAQYEAYQAWLQQAHAEHDGKHDRGSDHGSDSKGEDMAERQDAEGGGSGEGSGEADEDKGFTYTATYNLPSDADNGIKERTWRVRKLTGMTKPEASEKGREALREAHPDATLISERCNKPRGKAMKKGHDERRNNGGNGGSKGEGTTEGDTGQSKAEGHGEQGEGGEGGEGGEQGDESESEGQRDTPDDLMLMRLNNQPLVGEDANQRISDLAHNVVTEALKGFDPEAAEIDEEALAAKISEAVAKSVLKDVLAKMEAEGTKKIVIETNGKTVEIEGITHREFEGILKAVRRRFNLFLWGPSGSGKGFTAEQVAEALGLRYGFISCSGGMTEGQLLGRVMPNMSDGSQVYIRSQFVDFYENGGVFLLDEFDAIDPNVAIVINEALNSSKLALANRAEKPWAEKHEDFVCIVAANTSGGGETLQFTGRNRLDAATLNRFCQSSFFVGYDERVEKAIANSYLEPKAARDLLARFWDVRKNATDLKVPRVWGTRNLKYLAIAIADGDSMDEALKRAVSTWTPDEQRKVNLLA